MYHILNSFWWFFFLFTNVFNFQRFTMYLSCERECLGVWINNSNKKILSLITWMDNIWMRDKFFSFWFSGISIFLNTNKNTFLFLSPTINSWATLSLHWIAEPYRFAFDRYIVFRNIQFNRLLHFLFLVLVWIIISHYLVVCRKLCNKINK